MVGFGTGMAVEVGKIQVEIISVQTFYWDVKSDITKRRSFRQITSSPIHTRAEKDSFNTAVNWRSRVAVFVFQCRWHETVPLTLIIVFVISVTIKQSAWDPSPMFCNEFSSFGFQLCHLVHGIT